MDAHCHVGPGVMAGQNAEKLLKNMDRMEIGKAVIVPWDQAIAIYNREGNEYVAWLAKRHESRFIPFCTVNPWYGKAALEELERAADAGAKGGVTAQYPIGSRPVQEEGGCFCRAKSLILEKNPYSLT